MNNTLDIQQLVAAWQFLQSIAPVVHIDTEAEYAQTTVLLNSLLDVVRDDKRHPLYSLVSVVGDLIEAYEVDHEPFE